MGTFIDLIASDAFKGTAYVAHPAGKPRGGIVVLQEIFGVNHHIRAVADGYAAEGYLAIAPATFQRVEAGVELGYRPEDMPVGSDLKARSEALGVETLMKDVQAAVNHVAIAGKVGVVGYCWGGMMAWRAACLVDGVAASVPYYGGGTTTPVEIARTPKCPVMAHYAQHDTHIPLDGVEAFRKAHPEVEVHLYDAHHGFNCDERASWNANAAATAKERTLYFFGKHIG